jgi:Flp pilus assembly protein TadG
MKTLARRLVADVRGAAVIEMALVAPVLALTVIGIVDMSNAYSRKLALEQGAQRAIEKIMQTTETSTVETTLTTEAVCQVNGMNADGTCKTSPITAANVTVSYRLECKDATGSIVSTSTTTDATAFDALFCDPAQKEQRYLQVGLTDTYQPLFPIHFLSFNSSSGGYPISATAGMRTE